MNTCTYCASTQGQPHSPLCGSNNEEGCQHPSHCSWCGGATWRDGPVKLPPMPPSPPEPGSISRARRGDLVLARDVKQTNSLSQATTTVKMCWLIGKVIKVDPRTGYVTSYRDHHDRLIKLRPATERRVLSQRQLTVDSSVVVEAAGKLHDGRFDDLDEVRELVRTFCA